jgi:uncharacterized membrane protein
MATKNRFFLLLLIISILLTGFAFTQTANAQSDTPPQVKGILFYSPTCSHCHYIITEYFPEFFANYTNNEVLIIGVDGTTDTGMEMFYEAIDKYNIETAAFPTLIVGDTVMIGSGEIPDMLPGIVENGLANGGIEFPDLPLFLASLEQSDITGETATPVTEAPPLTIAEKFQNDLKGNILATIWLVVMITSVIFILQQVITGGIKIKPFPTWFIIAFFVIELCVAGYLSFVELTSTEAVCGPVGDCQSVQTSPYAYLFGLIPIGVIGVAGSLALIFTFTMYKVGPEKLRYLAAQAFWGFSLFGILFSIYLTTLEPFVIGATCMWCVSSAVLMTLIFYAATPIYIAERKANGEYEEDDDDDGNVKEATVSEN